MHYEKLSKLMELTQECVSNGESIFLFSSIVVFSSLIQSGNPLLASRNRSFGQTASIVWIVGEGVT